MQQELLHGFTRDLRESARARFRYTSAPKVAFQSGLQHIQVAVKLQNAFSLRRELLQGFARDLRESARARFCYTSVPKVACQSGLQHIQVAMKLQNAFSMWRPSRFLENCLPALYLFNGFLYVFTHIFLYVFRGSPRKKTYFFEERPLSK